MRERDVADSRSAAQDPFALRQVPVLRPSLSALQLLGAYGFEIESLYDWKGSLAGRPHMLGVRGYARGKRVSLRCRARKAANAAVAGASGSTRCWPQSRVKSCADPPGVDGTRCPVPSTLILERVEKGL